VLNVHMKKCHLSIIQEKIVLNLASRGNPGRLTGSSQDVS